MNHLKNAGKKLLSQFIIEERFGWPPSCAGIIYQPERPVCEHAAEEKPVDKDEQ